MESPITTTSSYISSTDAAQRYGLTNDHIASLCRRKKIDGALAGGRLWFVDEESLKAYLVKTQEAREARHRKLSEQIRKEQSVKAATPSWRMQGSGVALATALFVVGSVYASAAPARDTLAEVPWEYLPAAAASVSADFYDRTFVAAAVAYLDFVDGVGDIQAQSYLSLADGVSSAAAATLGGDALATAGALPAAVAETSVNGWVDMVTWYTQGYLAAVAAAGDVSEHFYTAAASTALATGDGLARSGEKLMASVAESSLAAAYASGDASEYFYDATARVALAAGRGVAYSGETMLAGFAEAFVDGLTAFGDAEAYVYAAVFDTMSESSETMGAAVASSILAVNDSATVVAGWYKEGSDRVARKMTPSAPSAPQAPATAAASEISDRGIAKELCIEDVCLTREELVLVLEEVRARQAAQPQ